MIESMQKKWKTWKSCLAIRTSIHCSEQIQQNSPTNKTRPRFAVKVNISSCNSEPSNKVGFIEDVYLHWKQKYLQGIKTLKTSLRNSTFSVQCFCSIQNKTYFLLVHSHYIHVHPDKRPPGLQKIISKQYSDAALAEHAWASFLNCFLNSQAKYKKTQLSTCTSPVNLKMSISSVHCLCSSQNRN